jgi:hypothetical protein
MQITVDIPDEVATRARAQGLTPEAYVETLIASQPAPQPMESREVRVAKLEKFLVEMAKHSDTLPILPQAAFTRESIYRDHD